MTVRDSQVDRALTVAFQRVFGTNDKNRSPEQLLVLARLRKLARHNEPIFSPTESDRTLNMRAGRLEMFLEIENRCTDERHPTIADLLGHLASTTGDDNA